MRNGTIDREGAAVVPFYMKHALKRIAIHVITIAALSGVIGVLLAEGPRLLEAGQRGALSPRTAMLVVSKGWKLSLDIAGIAALLSLVFLRAVPLSRAACGVVGGMIVGGLVGGGLAWPSEARRMGSRLDDRRHGLRPGRRERATLGRGTRVAWIPGAGGDAADEVNARRSVMHRGRQSAADTQPASDHLDSSVERSPGEHAGCTAGRTRSSPPRS